MWDDYEVCIKENVYECSIKHFEEPSEFGIDGGRISKLHVFEKKSGKWVINYDRGWDIRPNNDAERQVLKKCLELYN